MDIGKIDPYTVPVNQPQTTPPQPQPTTENEPKADAGSSGVTPPVPENIPKIDFYA